LIHPFRTGGFHFRKQVPIGRFVVDFACHAVKLVIEVDGDTHFTEQATRADSMRDAFLAQEGYRVLRFTNLDVMENPEGVYHEISVVLGF
jgi:very-short-patch-repair endonuclease